MSTRIGSFIDQHFQPRLISALVKVAMIGAFDGKDFLDEDDEALGETSLIAEKAVLAGATAQHEDDPSHPVAA